MKQKIRKLFAIVFLTFQILNAQSQSAEQVLQKSIQYHDPEGKWESGEFHFPLHESRPNGAYRLTDVKLDNEIGEFELKQIRGKDRVYRYLSTEACDALWNYEPVTSKEQKERLRLNCDGGNEFYRNYYAYLYGLPMKLKDPGTIIDPQVKKKDFFGKKNLLEIKVTYEQEVGEDIWYFYFDPKTYALSGYRFYHDEKANDGEYILLEGEITINGVKFPKERGWYTHKEGKYLGNDNLLPFPATKY
ncbi:MAG: DUF6503 family protein [Bacteroidota bacterium]